MEQVRDLENSSPKMSLPTVLQKLDYESCSFWNCSEKTQMYSFIDEWKGGIREELCAISRDWETYHPHLDKRMKHFIRMNEIHSIKTRVYKLNEQEQEKQLAPEQANNYIDLYELMYPGIAALTTEFVRKFGEKTIEEEFEAYIKKAKGQSRTNNIRAEENGFLFHFKRKHQLESEPQQRGPDHILNEILYYYIREQRNRQQQRGQIVLSLKQSDSRETRVSLS